ncbi:hypothetical protein BHE74_00055878 [Ensete ventricosum]|nr:hypothetical protein BHE74_00055878 [Ensete ventricosum]
MAHDHLVRPIGGTSRAGSSALRERCSCWRSLLPVAVLASGSPGRGRLPLMVAPSAKDLCWHYDELWSRDHHCKKQRLLMIEPIEESKHEEEDLEHEENMKEDPQLVIA